MEDDPRLPVDRLTRFAEGFLKALGCSGPVSAEVAAHLVEADLRGVYSHGTMRLPQYLDWVRAGMFDPAGEAKLTAALTDGTGRAPVVDGANGFGIPAMRLAVDEGVRLARLNGVAAMGVVNVGHTGRVGAFAEQAAEAGCLAILFGGGRRQDWRQVAPYGGAMGMLPTNPYAFGIPGGEHGPVVLDFATGAGAGGKIYAARYAGRPLPEGMCIDAKGNPTTDPEDYFNGGALLPMAGPKGYGMALIAELVGEAMLGPAMHGLNWIGVFIDLASYRAPGAYRMAAEECLAELRACPPAPGFDRVDIPGERERRMEAERRALGVPLAAATLETMRRAAGELGVDAGVLG
ncbi:MAG TPA: Ldh family oxidoreductase [Thermohalobaculum sp.]|nr:Ldh family oxidoreductase [Thermohalobaculum sp.]